MGKEVLNGTEITDIEFEEELNNNGDYTIVGYDDENNYLVYFNDTKRTYKVDKDGNITQLDNAPELVTEKIYVTLYSDGTLAFSNNSETDSTKTITKIYTISKDDCYDVQDMVPWKNETSSIKKVIFVNEIRPTSTKRWFRNCINMTTVENIANLNTSQVKDMSFMFCGCRKLTTLDLRAFDTRRVTNMKSMFNSWADDGSSYGEGMTLTSLNISSFDTRNVIDMSEMFNHCIKLTNLDVSKFNTSNVITMQKMFQDCSNITSLDLSNFNTSKVKNMYAMFYNCANINSLDLSNFDTKNVENTHDMFCGWKNDAPWTMALRIIYVGDLWFLSSTTDSTNMFMGCNNLVGSKGTTYNSSKVDKTYARIDGGPTSSTPGYFTYKNSN